ncbi:MAG TPA: TlyA family RNA methyltransferase [Candidatus Rothia avistercoris]|uniref:TlyA family RNA methyltransferase n=1 Tax=Candidatus Rothia avistercoris TaxID=2840479 RepID=A0A9D2UEH0_9MICC|nr:TlyA family RNA methyltransferase [Candidatus Rothia avistercoris]
MRLDQYMVLAKIARSRTLAAKMVEGGHISVNGRTVTKPAQKLKEGDRVRVRRSELTEYVSRAGHKLAGALDAFPEITVAGKFCLDAGASTGGFTDVLLRRGASRVAAVDVGHDQLVEQIRNHPSVDVYEGMNVRHMSPEDIGGQVALTVSDLSFISLTKVVEPLARATAAGGDLLLMVKPQFEVGPARIGKGGVVTDPEVRADAVASVRAAVQDAGLLVLGEQESPLPGQDGNVEFFLWCHKPDEATPAS